MLKLLAGAVLLTLFCVGAVAVFGPLALFFNLFAVCPVAFLALRNGLFPAVTAVILVAAVLWGLAGSANAAAYLVQFGISAPLLGGALRRGLAWDRSVALALLVTLAVAVAGIFAYGLRSGDNGFAAANRFVKAEVGQSLTALRQGDLPHDDTAELEKISVQVAAFLQRAWPGLLTAFIALTQLIAVYVLSARAWMVVVPGPAFAGWKSPEFLVWPLIAAGFAFFFAGGALATLAVNLLVVLLPVYFLHGLAIVSYFFQSKRIAPLLRSVGYAMIVLLNPLPLIVMLLGLFDLWADFRRPRVKNT